MTRTRGLMLALLATGTTILTGVQGASATELLPPVDLVVAYGVDIDLVVAPDGVATVVSERASDHRIVALTRRPGAAGFSSEPLSGAGADVRSARVAMTPDGAVVAAWVRSAGADELVEAAVRPAGGSAFGAPVTLTTPAGIGSAFELAVDPQGNATVAWGDPRGASAGYQVATLPAGTSAWAAVDAVGVGSMELGEVAVVADATGRVTVVWGWGAGLSAVSRPSGEADFGAPTSIASPGFALGLEIGHAPDGRLTAAWFNSLVNRFQAASWMPGEGSGRVFDLSPTFPEAPAEDSVLAVGTDGGVTVIWGGERNDGVSWGGVWASTLAPGATQPETHTIVTAPTGAVRFAQPAIVAAADGSLGVAWRRSDAGVTSIEYARRLAGSSFGHPERLVASEPDHQLLAPLLGADDEGNLTFVWRDGTVASGELLRSRVLDGAPPRLTDVAVPATVEPRAAAHLSAAPVDRWGVGSVVWDFGDGTTATGGAVDHAYSARGSYQVRVTATDVAGNATHLTRTLVVRDAIAPVLAKARLRPRALPTGRGARLRLTSSENAVLTGVVERRRHGTWRQVGTKHWFVQGGANDEQFYGRVAQRRLRSGTYRVLLTATDPAGNTSGPTTVRFGIDRSR